VEKYECWILTTEKIVNEFQTFEIRCKKRSSKQTFSLFKNKKTNNYNTIGEICEIGNGMVSGLFSFAKQAKSI